MDTLSHTDEEGRAHMVNVSHKPDQLRIARATGHIYLAPETVALIAADNIKKGHVLTVAEIAGIQAAKKTSDLIPLCHALHIGHVQVKAHLQKTGVAVTSEVSCVGKTGVEIEALTAVSVALLTVYDMCKVVDKSMKIGDIVLLEKTKQDVK